ncbi:unnamed protein product [Caenorhabditis brenneri]
MNSPRALPRTHVVYPDITTGASTFYDTEHPVPLTVSDPNTVAKIHRVQKRLNFLTLLSSVVIILLLVNMILLIVFFTMEHNHATNHNPDTHHNTTFYSNVSSLVTTNHLKF